MRSLRYGLLSVAACGLLLLIVGLAVLFGVWRTDALAQHEELVGAQLFSARQVYETVLLMESSQRGYLLTRDPAYLEPYSEEEGTIAGVLRHFEALFDGDPVAADEVADIRRTAIAKRAELARTLRLAKAGDFDGALAVVHTDTGKQAMDILRVRLSSLIFVKRSERTALIEQGQRTFHDLYLLVIGAGLLMLLLVAVAVRALSASIRRLDAAQKAEERHAMHDALTGLPNRRYLSEWLATALASTRRTGRRLCVLYFDLDGFKAVNDRFGHEAGDRVLKVTATRLRSMLRESDFVARLGGDEFVAVLPDAVEDAGVVALVRRIEENLRVAPIPELRDGETTPSIGAAFYPTDGSDVDALLAAADRAMYAIKQDHHAAPKPTRRQLSGAAPKQPEPASQTG